MAITSFTGKYSFLNTFSPCQITVDGLTYPTLENAFQASRCSYKTDRKKFVSVTPAEAKKLGGEVTTKASWREHQIEEMRNLLFLKFENRELSSQLLRTGNEELVYGNTWHDTFWGVCEGTGSNRLGKLLMEVRDTIRKRNETAAATEKQLAVIRGNAEAMLHLAALGLAPENLTKGIASKIIGKYLAEKEEDVNGTGNQ